MTLRGSYELQASFILALIDWQIGLPKQRIGYTNLLSAALGHVTYTLQWSYSATSISITMSCIQYLHAEGLLCSSAGEMPHMSMSVIVIKHICIGRSFPLLRYTLGPACIVSWSVEISQHDTGKGGFLCLQAKETGAYLRIKSKSLEIQCNYKNIEIAWTPKFAVFFIYLFIFPFAEWICPPSFSCRWFSRKNEVTAFMCVGQHFILGSLLQFITLCTLIMWWSAWPAAWIFQREKGADGDVGQTQRQVFSANGREGVWFADFGRGGHSHAQFTPARGTSTEHEEEEGATKWQTLWKVSGYAPAMRPQGYTKPDLSGDVIYCCRVQFLDLPEQISLD